MGKNDVVFRRKNSRKLYKIISEIGLLVIDEAQAIQDIGLILKFIVDHIEGIKVIATGSSMFDLANKLGEPLVGRKIPYFYIRFPKIEFSNYENYKQTAENQKPD